jgi:hypothetical protein
MSEFIYFLGMRLEYWTLIIAGIAILFTALKDFIIPLVFKPRLDLEGKNQEFYIEESEEQHTKKRYLRLKVFNKNNFWSKSAKNCYVKLIEIKKDGELMHPFTPVPLKWSSYDEEIGLITTRKHDLAKGEFHFIDLCHEQESIKKRLHFQTPIPPKLGIKLLSGIYTFKVGIYGDDFKPKIEIFRVMHKGNFGDLNFIENEKTNTNK